MLLLASLFLESSSILGRNDERLNHLGGIVIAVELVQLIQPEFVARVIGVLAAVRIAPQITHELHQHERAVEFVSGQRRILGYLSYCLCSRGGVAGIRCRAKQSNDRRAVTA